ncbi:hypothetical protein ACI75Y_07090 [Capnocytophaga stomatis]|uniref:hypothetical protein n=1 Tax=Capnocytophaga stomatis TaxID=1848904 RepID=UPI00385F3929
MTTKDTFLAKLFVTAENAGLKIISDEKCCQLLAWVYHIGGYTEESTHNVKLRESIFTAQKRLNILGGETPNAQLLPAFQKYEKELSDFINKKTNRPQWLTDLEKEYGLRSYKNKD